jgi:6-pyruvoyltetrahydropterin/6-carboxytetrahydropterin synthase
MTHQTSVSWTSSWCSLHRIPKHSGACRAFHGHTYSAELWCTACLFDPEAGMVLDFDILKTQIDRWIDDHWDHTALLDRNDTDPATLAIIEANAALGRPAFLFDGPPTVENIAHKLWEVATTLLAGANVEVTKVRVWESTRASAIVVSDDD